jgi:serine protease Do
MRFAGFGLRTRGVTATRAVVALAILGLPLAPYAVAADQVTGSVADRLPSLAPIVDRVLPAVVNISVVQKVGSSAGPEDQEADPQGGDNEDQDQEQGPSPHGGPQTPFDEFLRRFFEHQQQNHHGMQMPPSGQKVMSLGSGFIVDPAGFIVTNNHVIGDADKVTVIFQDNSKHPAKIVGKDAKTDLALLKIEADHPLPFVKFGDSDKARVGDWVIAVGDPFGLGGTVTKGIISARGRPVEDQSYVDFLQVDASINKGNSGGPTFDLAGDVIGINTAIFSPNGGSVGIGFAIPSNSAKPVIDQLKNAGHVDRGWLGVQIQEVTPEIASSIGMDQNHPIGALVAAVSDNSPAAKAGIKVGDVVEKFDGKPVDKMRDLPRLVAETVIGKSVEIGVLRGGQHINVQTTVAQLNETKVAAATGAPEEKAGKATALGLSLSVLNPDARKRLNLPKEIQGVLVRQVKEGSPAAEHGIEAGDVIVQVNGKDVGKPDDVVDQVKTVKPGDKKSVLLLVNRGGQNRFVAIEPEEKNG